MIIRPLQDQDLTACRETIIDAIENSDPLDHGDQSEFVASWSEAALALLTEPEAAHAITIVCQVGNEIAGLAQLNRDGEIKLFYVKASWQRRSIGRALLAELALNAQCLGIECLQIYSSNTSRLFFLAHGFRAKFTDFSEWLTTDLSHWKLTYEHTITH
ncbi:GNAT family N-acetyltransferase [Chitinibacter sp. S2-10]|uniref:GNAT family N-acetyltransferase n=1 Tax=Chitinibacter sp. S2-10 TaxID=3373597 RepID=UPI003977AA5E